MTVFVLDEGGTARDWSGMVHPSKKLEWNNASREWRPQTPKSGDVVLCHSLTDGAKGAVSKLADDGVFVVVVSGGGGAGTVEKKIYYRRAVVTEGCDKQFSAYFKCFREDLEAEKTPNWKLLEGPPPADALLAYHLLGLLPGDDEASQARVKLRSRALTEATVIALATGISGLADSDIDNQEKLREFLEHCA